ncbi:MAG: SpoVA/SpoVAEb family sporulation membrane protein [Clostridia bacterium]|nr:SpoVA/SpoVAEb family sporulation membrane protein [Clostridia bacterium]
MIYLKAFIIGGLLCVVGQILIDKTKLTPARILVLYVVVGVALGAFGLFAPLREFAGSGATVPLLGFGAVLAEGTKAVIDKEGAIGILTGPLSSGAGGIAVAIISGLIMSCITKPRAK